MDKECDCDEFRDGFTGFEARLFVRRAIPSCCIREECDAANMQVYFRGYVVGRWALRSEKNNFRELRPHFVNKCRFSNTDTKHTQVDSTFHVLSDMRLLPILRMRKK